MSKNTRKRPPQGRVNQYDPEKLVVYGIDKPAPADNHPLADKDLARLRRIDPALVANMEEHGVILPIVTKKVGTDIVVVEGRRRVIHMRIANRNRVAKGLAPLLVRAVGRSGPALDIGDKLIALSANTYRVDPGPWAQALEIRGLVQQNVPREQIMLAFGCSDQSLANRLALLDLGSGVQAAIEAGDIGPMAALELRGLAVELQDELLARLLVEGGPKRGMVPRLRVLRAEAEAGEATNNNEEATNNNEEEYTLTEEEQATYDRLVAKAASGDASAVAELYAQETPDFQAKWSLEDYATGFGAFHQEPDDELEDGSGDDPDDEQAYERVGAILTPKWPRDVRDRRGMVLGKGDTVRVEDAGQGPAFVGEVVQAHKLGNGHTLRIQTEGGFREAHTNCVQLSVEATPLEDENGPQNSGDDPWPPIVLDRGGGEILRHDWVVIREPGGGTPYHGRVVAAFEDGKGHALTVARRGDGKRLLSHSRYALGTNEPDGEELPAEDWPQGVRCRLGNALHKGDWVHVEDKGQTFDGQIVAATKSGRGHMLQLLNAGVSIEAHSRHATLTSAPPPQPTATQIAQAKAPRQAELRRLLEHREARKLLSDEMAACIRWIIGQAAPSRRMSAAIEASKTAPRKSEGRRRGRHKNDAVDLANAV